MEFDRDLQILLLILKYTRRISLLTSNVEGKEEFVAKYEFVDLASFWLLQISENCNKLSLEFKQEFGNIPWREIIRFRTIPAHWYESLDVDILWDILVNDIPILHEFVQQYCEIH